MLSIIVVAKYYKIKYSKSKLKYAYFSIGLNTLVKMFSNISELASCQWGPPTVHEMGILTEMYVILAP